MDLREKSICRLASVSGVGVQDADPKVILYTIPLGKKCIITHVVVRSATASLADGVDFNFGEGAGADTWKETVDLSGLVDATTYYVVTSNDALNIIFNEAEEFGIISETGATADAEVTIEVFGYLYDA